MNKTPQNALPNNSAVIERLTTALEELTTGAGDARKRLQNAALTLSPLMVEQFPDSQRDVWADLWTTLNAAGPVRNPPSGSLNHTIDQMSNEEASAHIKEIWRIYWQVSSNRLYK